MSLKYKIAICNCSKYLYDSKTSKLLTSLTKNGDVNIGLEKLHQIYIVSLILI